MQISVYQPILDRLTGENSFIVTGDISVRELSRFINRNFTRKQYVVYRDSPGKVAIISTTVLDGPEQ